MNIHNKNIVITGAANGIGHALAKRIIQESPKSISLIDISSSVNEVARSMNADSYVVDVSNENDFQSVLNLSLIHISEPRDCDRSRMPSSA